MHFFSQFLLVVSQWIPFTDSLVDDDDDFTFQMIAKWWQFHLFFSLSPVYIHSIFCYAIFFLVTCDALNVANGEYKKGKFITFFHIFFLCSAANRKIQSFFLDLRKRIEFERCKVNWIEYWNVEHSWMSNDRIELHLKVERHERDEFKRGKKCIK